MKQPLTRTRMLGFAVLAATSLATASSAETDDDGAGDTDRTASRCELFEVPETKWPGFSDMVIEGGGTPWIMANNKVFYWAGTEFREPVSGPMNSGYYLAGLYGGPDGRAYATQRGEEEHQGLIYELNDGAAKLLTTFYYEVSHEYPGLYVSKDGRIFNWGKRFLAVYDGKKWDRIEAKLALRLDGIFDLGKQVYFYYDDALYRATATGKLEACKCPKWKQPGQDRYRLVSALWGGKRAIVVHCGRPGLFAFDLTTGDQIDLTEATAVHQETTFWDAFSLKNGDVWILGQRRGAPTSSFFTLSAAGKLLEVPATRNVPWNSALRLSRPESVLETSDGTLIFGIHPGGLAILRGGRLTRWGWRYGLTGGVSPLHEDRLGNVWFPLKGKVARLRLADGPPAAHPSAADWEEIVLAERSRLWEPQPGRLAMFRADQPGELSRWDGKNWTHQEVPFSPTKIGRSATDDRGHLLIAPAAHPDGYFDVGPNSIERFDTMQALLVSAVAGGARGFRTGRGFQGIVVTPKKHIWFGYHNYSGVMLYDGVRWDRFGFSDDVYYMFPSPKYGILFRTQGARFYTYDRGQMVEVPPLLRLARTLMIGRKHLQPYERALTDVRPREYYPVLREREKTTIWFDPEEYEAFIEGKDAAKEARRAVLPRHAERISPAPSGGAWVFGSGGSGPPLRLFGGSLHPVDLTGTPVARMQILNVKEDAAGGFWFLTRYGGSPRAFHYCPSEVGLKVDAVPRECGRELAVKVSAVPERIAGEDQLFTRVNNGRWTAAERKEGTCLFRFPASGDYRCEIMGLRFGGQLGNSASLAVRATVHFPETVLTTPEDKVFVVDTLEWEAPVAIEKTSDAEHVALLWRTVGGSWQRVCEGAGLPMSGLDRGQHTLELCAEEEGFWQDPSPVRVQIQFAPDYEKIVSACVGDLLSEDAARRAAARKKLFELGEKGLPILERRLQEAAEAARLVAPLERVLQELRRQERGR